MEKSRRQITFPGPGMRLRKARADETIVPLVADVRELELSRHPVLESLCPSLADFCAQARAVAAQVGHCLPPELREPPTPQMPGFWDCYRDQFARFSVVPAIVNHQIARQALAPGGELAILHEKRDSAWWRERTGAYEAVTAAAAGEPQVPVHTRPGGVWRSARNLVLPMLSHVQALLGALNSYGRPTAATRSERISAGDCDVLFLAVGATAAPIIARLAGGLADDHGLKSVAADLHFGGSTRALGSANIPVVDADPRWYGSRLIRDSRSVWPKWWQHFQAELAAAGDELGGWEWLMPLLHRRMLVTLAHRAALGLAELAAARVIIETLTPRVVVGFHLYADMLAPLMLTAHLRGIPTICCQHGIRGPYHRTLGSLPWDRFLVFGQYTADLLADLLDPATDVEITGHCLYDDVVTSAQPEAGTALRTELAGAHEYAVLVATQPDEYEVQRTQPRWWLEATAQACASADAAMLIKVHPEERQATMYRRLARQWPDAVTVIAHGEHPLAELIPACDLLVTRDSTIAYEANLWDKPVITVDLSGQRDRFAIASDGGGEGVHRYEDIEPAIRSLLTDVAVRDKLAASRTEFLRSHLGPRDGQATARIAAAIARAAQGHPA